MCGGGEVDYMYVIQDGGTGAWDGLESAVR